MFNKIGDFINDHWKEITFVGIGFLGLACLREGIRNDIDDAFNSHHVEVKLNTDSVNRLLVNLPEVEK